MIEFLKKCERLARFSEKRAEGSGPVCEAAAFTYIYAALETEIESLCKIL